MEPLETRLQKRMHVSLYALLFLTCLLGLSVLLEGCTDSCETEIRYTYFEPVYQTSEEIRSQTRLVEPQPITAVGKIYIKDNHLFINDPGKGIHIIDNGNPAQPQVKGFLQIPGTFDLAIKGNTLYADSYIDLVAFDISNIADIQEVNRRTNVFSYFNQDVGFYVDPAKGIITHWQENTNVVVNKNDCSFSAASPVMYYENGVIARDVQSFNSSLAIAPGTGSGPGVGGSMARFTIAKNFLYTLSAGYLQPFDVTSEANPVPAASQYVMWDIETIFPYGNNLFLGSRSGMHIFNLANPQSPQKISTYEHVSSCDPVVVQDKYAYVTLRSGTECQGFTNQLEVIDIENISSPSLVKVYPMTNPHGLGVDGNLLFICDGSDGLKIYDAADVNTIGDKLIKHYRDINALDVIPFNDVLIMIGEDGLFQYDYSNPQDITLLSHLSVQ